MAVNKEKYFSILNEASQNNAVLVAVSKTKPIEDILELYELGHRDFGENYVQELLEKEKALPKDIRWHFIGHLQSNKVKFIAPFIHLIHGCDSLNLFKEIDKQGNKINRSIDILFQVYIAKETTKFGMDENELLYAMAEANNSSFQHCKVKGLMGMASLTEDISIIRDEFKYLRSLYKKNNSFSILSMGMSNDYKIALEEGSTLLRIGSLLFGERKN